MNEENPHLINQGSYGCIFYPGLSCNNDNKTESNNITKIQKLKNTSEKETKIGKKIQKISNYKKYYAPIINSCEVNISKIENQEITKCNFIDIDKQEKYLSNTIPYVGKDTLLDYTVKIIKNQNLFKTILQQHIKILEGLHKLSKKGIIHLDLKENNIMVSENGIPKIIDFGLSFEIQDLERSKYEEIFFIYTVEYGPWCIEIVMINYLIHKLKNETITIDEIKRIVTEYVNKNNAIVELLTTNEKEELKRNYIEYFQNIISPKEEMIKIILKTFVSWDNYSLSVIYLYILKNLNIELNVEEADGQLSMYIKVLKMCLINDPKKRKEPKETIKEITSLFGNMKRKEYTKMIDIQNNNIQQNITEIEKSITETKIKDINNEKPIYKIILV